MKKIPKPILFFVILFVLILVQFLLPWWCMVFPLLIHGYFIPRTSFRAFMNGFLLIFLLWLLYACFIGYTRNDAMSVKMTSVLFMGNKYILYLCSSVIGGIVGGCSALLGYYLRK